LSHDELLHGAVDGERDGGIDGFFILVNGHLLDDPESFVWPRSSAELRLILVTCKHHETFKQATLDSLVATLTELLDFAIDDKDLKGAYSDRLLRVRSNLKFAYRKLSPRLNSFSVSAYYASRGDTQELGAEVAARGEQIALLIRESFGACQAEFAFVGATELVELHRKIRNYTLELPFVEALTKGVRYVLLARLTDYFNFVTDGGRLRRYLFDSNVRDFMGMNRVNEDIQNTLRGAESPDFWWLNNGVTMLASSAAITGKSIQISDIQIVNGLQTTESIFRYFQGRDLAKDQRCVLVKVIITNDEAVRDAIIRATNNQTDVELASLHATDKIQRDVEDIFLRHGLFYERRKNYYANQGRSPAELVTPLYAAAGYLALALKEPHKASKLRSRFMRVPASYEQIFDESAPLDVWPKIVQTLKRVDEALEALRPRGKGTERFLKGWRYVIALILVAQHFGKFSYSKRELTTFDVSTVTFDSVKGVWAELYAPDNGVRMVGWTSLRDVVAACQIVSKSRGIRDVEAISRGSQGVHMRSQDLSAQFIESVRQALPAQPWKPGVHIEVSRKLKCDIPAYRAAVEQLIEDGIFLRQKDGVLYDEEGSVVSFDTERVDPETLQLRPADE